MVSFLFCLLGDNSVLFRGYLVQRPFCIFLLFFFRSLIGNFLSFLFLLSSIFDWEFSLFVLSTLLIGNFSSFFFVFLLRERFMVSWDFGSRLVEWLDMIYVRVWFGSRIKGDVPHYFHNTNATMMIWKFYAKLVMHAPMLTEACLWCFYGGWIFELQ